MIGAYKIAYSKFVAANDIYEKKWRVAVLSRILMDLRDAEDDLKANQNEIIESIHENVLKIIKKMSKLHPEGLTHKFGIGVLAFYICSLCMLLLNSELDWNWKIRVILGSTQFILQRRYMLTLKYP